MGRLARVAALRSPAARGSCPTPSGRWLAVSSCASRDAVALADVAASALAPSSSKFDGSLSRARHRFQRFRGSAPGLPSSGRTSEVSGMYRTNINDVPKVEGLKREDGWIDMQVQFLVDKTSAGANHVVGWTVLRPGASHEQHLHRNC